MAIWKLNRNGEIILHKDAIGLCPLLAKLKDENLKYLISVYDYIDGPYSKKPESERKNIAIKKIFNGVDPKLEFKSWFNEAKEDFLSCIYDSKKATINAYNTKITILNGKLADPDIIKDSELKGYSASVDLLQRQKDKLEQEVQLEEDLYEAKGKRPLSLLEKMKLSRELYGISKKTTTKVVIVEEQGNELPIDFNEDDF